MKAAEYGRCPHVGTRAAWPSLFVALASSPATFKGGSLVPVPPLLLLFFASDASGNLSLPFSCPAGVPAGMQIVHQFVIQDPGAPKGFALSNGLGAKTP
jgi:hypothetical protein